MPTNSHAKISAVDRLALYTKKTALFLSICSLLILGYTQQQISENMAKFEQVKKQQKPLRFSYINESGQMQGGTYHAPVQAISQP